ncbi:MAG: hypothetical protein EPN93_06350 [Spirochaetes bacterium]|nr:MAG: hypothetical protein EPN93_06350 [Spirochaetota bacterium]
MKPGEAKSRYHGTWVLVCAALAAFTACLDVDRMNINLTLDEKDLYTGQAKIEFLNIHSTEGSPEKQKREMDELFLEYRAEADNVLRVMPLYDPVVTLRNKKALSTDAVIEGKFKNVLSVLASLLSEGEFRVEGDRKTLSVYCKNPFNDSDETDLIIRYPGKILSHNSKNFDAKTHTMKWRLGSTGDREIRFALKSE